MQDGGELGGFPIDFLKISFERETVRNQILNIPCSLVVVVVVAVAT